VTGDQIVEKGADRLHELADRAAARGDGVGEWLSKELRDDAAFLRKLKPSLIAARARGEAPTDKSPEAPPSATAPTDVRTEAPPSAIAPRDASTETPPVAAAPPEPQQLKAQQPKPKSKRKRRGPPPVAIIGAAFVAGILLAKVVDWRGHAHPRD
jgi:hypothetical protein